jgi:hypothetical protein
MNIFGFAEGRIDEHGGSGSFLDHKRVRRFRIWHLDLMGLEIYPTSVK